MFRSFAMRRLLLMVLVWCMNWAGRSLTLAGVSATAKVEATLDMTLKSAIPLEGASSEFITSDGMFAVLPGVQRDSHMVFTAVNTVSDVCGALTLAAALSEVAAYALDEEEPLHLVAYVSSSVPTTEHKALLRAGWVLLRRGRSSFEPPAWMADSLDQPGFGIVEALHLHELVDRVVYMDARVLPLPNLDLGFLLSCPYEVSAVTSYKFPGWFDLGVVALELSPELAQMFQYVSSTVTIDEAIRSIPRAYQGSPGEFRFDATWLLNLAFPKWHDLEGTNKHHNPCNFLTPSREAFRKVSFWVEQSDHLSTNALLSDIVDQTQMIYYEGFPPWSCSADCVTFAYGCAKHEYHADLSETQMKYMREENWDALAWFWWTNLAKLPLEVRAKCQARTKALPCIGANGDAVPHSQLDIAPKRNLERNYLKPHKR